MAGMLDGPAEKSEIPTSQGGREIPILKNGDGTYKKKLLMGARSVSTGKLYDSVAKFSIIHVLMDTTPPLPTT